MNHPPLPLDQTTPLDYAPPSLRRRHSFYSFLALAMAVISILWLAYINISAGHPPHVQILNPFWCALYDNYNWPGLIGLTAAMPGLIQSNRKHTLSILAIIIILTYAFLLPPMNFA